MADFYVYDPAANEYAGPIKELEGHSDFSYCKEPDGTWTANFHEIKFTVEFHGMVDLVPKTEWGLYLLLEKWDQDISEHGGTL